MATPVEWNDELTSGNVTIDALLKDYAYIWNFLTDQPANTLFYTFNDGGNHDTGYALSNIQTLDTSQQNSVVSVLDELAGITGINFVYTGNIAESSLFFYTADISGPAGFNLTSWGYSYGYYLGDPYIIDLDIVSRTYVDNDFSDFSPGQYGYHVLLHEIGHALGLKHPFEGDVQLDPWLDNTGQTVMSYTHIDNDWPTSYRPLDLQALDFLYGSDGLGGSEGVIPVIIGPTNADDQLAGTDDRDWIDALAGNDVIYGSSQNDAIIGGAGIDRLVYDAVSLQAGTVGRYDVDSQFDYYLHSAAYGFDYLKSVERVYFADRSLALDIDGHAGTAVRFLGMLDPALLDDTPAGFTVMGVVLDLVDGGEDLNGLFHLALQQGLIGALAGGEENRDIARLALANVLDSSDQQTIDWLAGFMEGPDALSQAGFLATVAQLDVNVHIDWNQLQLTGVPYLPMA